MKNKKYHHVGTVPQSKRQIYTTNAHIHDRALELYWLGTVTSMKNGGKSLKIGVITSSKLKDRQHNCQMKKNKQ
jgi:hypothetical protein